MTEHLQECHQPKYLKDLSWGSISRDEPFVPCICDALRACEERIIQAESLRLEALHDEMANWSSAETQEALAAFPELTVDQWMWAQRGVRRSVQVLTRDQRRSG